MENHSVIHAHSTVEPFTVFLSAQVVESLSEMDFQLFLDLYFTDGDYT